MLICYWPGSDITRQNQWVLSMSWEIKIKKRLPNPAGSSEKLQWSGNQNQVPKSKNSCRQEKLHSGQKAGGWEAANIANRRVKWSVMGQQVHGQIWIKFSLIPLTTSKGMARFCKPRLSGTFALSLSRISLLLSWGHYVAITSPLGC